MAEWNVVDLSQPFDQQYGQTQSQPSNSGGWNVVDFSSSFTPSYSYTPQPTQQESNWVTGGGLSGFFDILNTPQQMMFGALTAKPEESLWQAMSRGAQQDVSGQDVSRHYGMGGDLFTGGLLQFGADPLNFIPAKWLGLVGEFASLPVVAGAEKAMQVMGKYDWWVDAAKKVSSTAYRTPAEATLNDLKRLAMERYGTNELSIIEDLHTGGGLEISKKISDDLAQQLGKDPEFMLQTLKQGIKQDIPYGPYIDLKGNPIENTDVKTILANIDPKQYLSEEVYRKWLDDLGAPSVPSMPPAWAGIFNPQKADGQYYQSALNMLLKDPTEFQNAGIVMMSPADAMKQMKAMRPDHAFQMDALERVARRFQSGEKFSIPVIDEQSGIQDGMHRLLLAQKEGLKEVPVLRIAETPENITKPFASTLQRGPLVNITQEIADVYNHVRHIPLKLPQEVTNTIYEQKAMYDMVMANNARILTDTPQLRSFYTDYLYNLVTKDAQNQIAKALGPMGGKKKWNYGHADYLVKEFDNMPFDEINRIANEEGLVINGTRIKIDKLLEDNPMSVETFRRLRAARSDAQVQLMYDAAEQLGKDLNPIREEVIAARRETIKNNDMAYRSLKAQVEAGEMTQQQAEAIMQRLRQNTEKPLEQMMAEAVPDGWTTLKIGRSNNPALQKLAPYFKDKIFPSEIARDLDNYINFSTQSETMDGFMQMLDVFRQNWVAGTLYAFPSTMMKNVVGNLFNNSLAGMNTVSHLKWYDYMRQIQKGFKTGGEIVINGKSHSIKDLYQKLSDMGVFAGGLSREAEAFAAKHMGKDLHVYRVPLAGKLLKKGERTYRWFEDNARGAHFLYKWLGEGLTPMEARASTLKYLFDYLDIPDFWKKVRTFVPFLQWTRNNVPLQISSLIKNPLSRSNIRLAELISLVRDNEAARRVDQFHQTVVPDFIKEQFGLPTRLGQDGNPEYFLLGTWIPLMELETIAGSRFIKKAYQMLAPYVKIPTEQYFNYDPFIQRQIEKYPGETKDLLGMDVPRRLIHIAKFLRFVTEADNITKGLLDDQFQGEQKTWAQRIVRFFLGGGTQSINLEYGEKKRQRLIKDLIGKLRYERNEANRDALREQIEELTFK